MQTQFSLAALANPDMAQSEKILRSCVHCGFCLATCPTYLLTANELDSPRGRIYLIKDMLEKNASADKRTTYHIDRCLSCLSCMTTCPSSVDYMHLVDHAREFIEKTAPRPISEKFKRDLLSYILPRPKIFRLALQLARLFSPFQAFLPVNMSSFLRLAPKKLPAPSLVDQPQIFLAQGARRMRVALLSGCAQTVLDPKINEATIRVLTRFGAEVVIVEGIGCCGAVAHHLGKVDQSHQLARKNIKAWKREIEAAGLDYIVVNASGCGTTIKDYKFLFRDDPEMREGAAEVSERAIDICEIINKLDYEKSQEVPKLRVAYHSACSSQHGQKITHEPYVLLQRAGFEVMAVPEGHICCGSAGTYNLLQPDLSQQLLQRKLANINSLDPHIIAAGNFGCMMHIGNKSQVPVAHLIELLDWASGGPKPQSLNF